MVPTEILSYYSLLEQLVRQVQHSGNLKPLIRSIVNLPVNQPPQSKSPNVASGANLRTT